MRTLFYSATVLVLLAAFFGLASLIQTNHGYLQAQESTLTRLERIDYLFENVGQDLSELLQYECGADWNVTNVTIIFPGDPSPPHDRVINYETFIEENYPGADLDLTGLLDDLGNGNNYIIIIDGHEIKINYNVPKVSFDVTDGVNVTLDFPGYTDRIEWQPEPGGDVPICIFTPDFYDCQNFNEGAANADVFVNDTNHEPAGRVQVHVSGNMGVQVFANLVDNNLIPWVNITLSFPGTGQPVYLSGTTLTYTLQNTNRTDGIIICQ